MNVSSWPAGFALIQWTPEMCCEQHQEVSDDETEALQTLQRGVQTRSDTTFNRRRKHGQGGGEELGISTRQFRRWRDELEILGNDAFPGQGRSRDEELTALKRELAQVKKERDFLKEAAAYFAKGSK
jgi:transposase